MTEKQNKDAGRDKREAVIQLLRIASYSVSLLVMVIVLFMLATQANIMRHVSQTMEDAAGAASEFDGGGETTFGD